MNQAVSEEELKWRARSDARTLAEAEEIKADKSRLANAQKEAKNILAEEKTNLKGISKVAGKSAISSSPCRKNRSGLKRQSFEPYGGFPTTPTM